LICGCEYGFARGARAGPLLIMECDRRGQVLWMSDRARSTLATADNLVAAIPAEVVAGILGPLRPISVLYFFRLLEWGDRVLIGVQLVQPKNDGCREATGLMLVQSNLLRHYFRLQHVERDLSTRARQNRLGGGRHSIVQIEQERQRLGRELHTGIGQMLAAIRLQLEIIGTQVPEAPTAVKQALGRISTLASEALEQVRSVSRRLHPPEWQRLTLETALQQLWEISGIPQRFQTSLRIAELPHEPDLEVKVLMYRATQEAISNLTRHSRATRIDLSLEMVDRYLVLTIEDNGVGFDVRRHASAPASVANGIGLRSIREQAAAVGGKLVVESGLDGTKLEVSAPFSQAVDPKSSV
jgi:signal transduction histidine kinase